MASLLFLIAVSIVPMQSSTQQLPQTGAVTGYVWNGENAPIPDAAVLLRNTASGDIALRATTNEAGMFTFVAVPPGQYVVELSRGADDASTIAVGHPFSLSAGETVATFVRMGSAQPVLIPDRSPLTFSGSVSWSNDMTADNKRMTGGTVEVAWPVGRGSWIAVESGFFQSTYPHQTFAPSHIRKATFQVAGRIGNPDRHGMFAQASVGLWLHSEDFVGIGGSRETARFWTEDVIYTLGPSVGVDLPLTRRLSVTALVDVFVLPQHPRDRWVHPRLTTGLTYRLDRD